MNNRADPQIYAKYFRQRDGIPPSVETALNSSGDVFFTATAEEFDRKKKGE